MIDTAGYKTILEARREELRRRRERIGADLHQPGDRDLNDQAIQRENDEVLTEMDEDAFEELRRIDAALERIRLGTYGSCAVCGAEISSARLEAVPTATRCRDCAL
ncbi:TraR/DksA family transcriptional regulator [Pararhizobium haloflavum]|uniref:TraR/DksA family transcriptional regulator n=1 Tax=Pararhizobium haloflavum TaxID=2037914 RepID=UPI000C181DA9|nr:TraR/DksA family transcriptional regulator [Pararhizobium haloflavum]